MSHPIRRGLSEAWANARRVMGGGVVAFLLYWAAISFGPGFDGWANPVITQYRLENMRALQNGGFSFRPTFIKRRDCTYFGVTWFAQDEMGNLVRIQLGRQSDPGPPITGPTGLRLGDRVTIYPPEGTVSIFGLNHHECGWPWQTRTMVGPFEVVGGRPRASALDGGDG